MIFPDHDTDELIQVTWEEILNVHFKKQFKWQPCVSLLYAKLQFLIIVINSGLAFYLLRQSHYEYIFCLGDLFLLVRSVIHKETARVWFSCPLNSQLVGFWSQKEDILKRQWWEICILSITGFLVDLGVPGAGLVSGGLEGCMCFPRKAGQNSLDESIFLDLSFSCLAFQGQ